MTVIRDATPDDLTVITDYNAAMAWETESIRLDRKRLEAGVDAVLKDPAKGRYFLAEIDGEVIAQAMLTYEWSDWRNRIWWWFQSVYVHPDHRRKGVFRVLYDRIHAQAEADPGVAGLRLYVERENETAQKTYVNLGMTESCYRMFEIEKEA